MISRVISRNILFCLARTQKQTGKEEEEETREEVFISGLVSLSIGCQFCGRRRLNHHPHSSPSTHIFVRFENRRIVRCAQEKQSLLNSCRPARIFAWPIICCCKVRRTDGRLDKVRLFFEQFLSETGRQATDVCLADRTTLTVQLGRASKQTIAPSIVFSRKQTTRPRINYANQQQAS